MWVDSGDREMKSQKRLFADELVGIVRVGCRLKGMYHIWEFDGVTDEEDWQIVSNQIIVSVFGVEFYCKPSRVANCFGRPSGTHYGGKTDEDRRLFLGVLKEFCASILCHALVHLKVAMCTSPYGVNDAFGDAFAVEVSELLNQMNILQ